jgi:hypothetical protein
MKNYHILFKFLNLSKTDSDILNDKISRRMEFEIDNELNPFEYNNKLNAWFMASNKFEIPSGGYDTKEQAEIALAIWKIKPFKDYQELYKLSKFIVNGLGD